MKKMQARLFMVFMALFVTVSTSTLASAAQNQLSAPAPETTTQGVYPFLVIIIEIICPLPLAWPLV